MKSLTKWAQGIKSIIAQVEADVKRFFQAGGYIFWLWLRVVKYFMVIDCIDCIDCLNWIDCLNCIDCIIQLCRMQCVGLFFLIIGKNPNGEKVWLKLKKALDLWLKAVLRYRCKQKESA